MRNPSGISLSVRGEKKLKVTYADGRFICHSAERDERNRAKSAGFQWDRERNELFTSKVLVAAKLRDHMDATSVKELSRQSISWSPWLGRFVYPAGLTPREHQFTGARWALERNRSYIAHEPGLGKTITASLIQNVTDGAALYLCPPYMVDNVDEELKKWTFEMPYAEPSRASFGPCDPEWPPPLWIYPDSMLFQTEWLEAPADGPLTPPKGCIIVGWKKMKGKRVLEVFRMHPEIRAFIKAHKELGHKLTLFVDEAHRFKSEFAKRARSLFALTRLFDKIVYLSGTPMPNRPIELWPVLSNSAPETIDYMSWEDYGRRYCAGYRNGFGWDFSGASNVEELAAKVQKNFMHSLSKEEALDLPPLTEELLLIGKNLTPKVAQMDREVLRQFSPDDLMGHIAVNDHLATYRKELGILKAPHAVSFINNLLTDTDEAILIFAIHKEVIRKLAEGLKKHHPIVVTGSVDVRERQAMVDEFQRNPRRRLFMANIQAGGTGYTLTKATRALFVEFSWSGADNDQARDRIHRIGQTSSVLAQYMVFKNSVDRRVIEAVLRKQKSTRLM